MFQRKDKGKKKATDVRKSASPPKPKQRVRRKVLFVGDYNVGKTTMVLNLRFGEKTNEFISSFYDGVNVELDSPRRLPTEEEGFFVINEPKGQKGRGRKEKWPPTELKESDINLDCWDVLFYEDEGQRPLAYRDAHLIVLCAAVNNRDSLESITDRWLPELAHHLPEVPIILIGSKSDLRSPPNSPKGELEFTIEEGKAMARQIGALAYTEYNFNMYMDMGAMAEFLIYYAFETWIPPKSPKSGWFTWLFG